MKTIVTIDQIPTFVTTMLIPLLETKRIFTLQGSLGAGKTTLTKEFLKQCGIIDTVVSPTFGYVNAYTNATGYSFFHFDLYRLEAAENFLAMGFDEYLNTPNTHCIIEWPEVIAPILTAYKNFVCSISLENTYNGTDARQITIL